MEVRQFGGEGGTRNRVFRNSIFDNENLGTDLGGDGAPPTM